MEHGTKSPAPDYRQTSFWLETAGEPLAPRAALSGDITVDVAILGAGYSGLWTAYYLLRNHPGLDVAIIEKDIAGFGCSGRNGGWCSPRFSVDPASLERRVGLERTRQTMLALHDAVDEVGRMCAAEAIDAQVHEGGLLGIARGAAQLPALHAGQAAYERLGLGHYNRLLSAEETRERVQVSNLAGGLLTSAGTTVHPGRLVRGLARAVERLGGVIYEQTAVASVETGAEAGARTARGRVRARKAVVVAGESFLAQLEGFRRDILPISSMIVLTEPLTEAQWQAVGWEGRESLNSQSKTTNYLTRTADGRILFGSRGAAYLFGSRIAERHDERVFEWMRGLVREWFPALGDVRFSHAWGGNVGMPRDWMPTVNFDAESRLARIHGYTGRGVSTTNLGGRLLAGLIGGETTGLETLPMHRADTPRWEPEPLRWLGVRYMQQGYARIDRAQEAGHSLPADTPLVNFLGNP